MWIDSIRMSILPYTWRSFHGSMIESPIKTLFVGQNYLILYKSHATDPVSMKFVQIYCYDGFVRFLLTRDVVQIFDHDRLANLSMAHDMLHEIHIVKMKSPFLHTSKLKSIIFKAVAHGVHSCWDENEQVATTKRNSPTQIAYGA